MVRVAAVVEQCWHKVPGGTAIATVGTLKVLAARDNLQLIGLSAKHKSLPSLALPPSLSVCELPMPRRVLYDSWHYLRYPDVSQFAGEVDVVHSTGGVVPPKGNAALVVTVHDLAFLKQPAWFTRRGVRFATKAFELAQAEATLIIVPSQSTAQDCVDNGVPSQRIRVISWGVDMETATEVDVRVVRDRYGLPESFALWVGTAEPRKNLESLLAAVSRTETKPPLVLAGPLGWGLNLEELIEAYPVEVIRVGYVRENRDLAALYAASKVFIYPSLMEGFGLPVLEAMTQGTPVITSSGTATEEVCADASSTVDPTDIEELAAAIDLIFTDDTEHARRSEVARTRATQFSWATTAKQVHSAYLEACC
ncbi:MAG: glycosyltransferase family 1 protein [Acidimicrobiaceae bacterium]|nr:glycosyltransferase family 1 protein [Acidimicrobiaceae bacterium]